MFLARTIRVHGVFFSLLASLVRTNFRAPPLQSILLIISKVHLLRESVRNARYSLYSDWKSDVRGIAVKTCGAIFDEALIFDQPGRPARAAPDCPGCKSAR